MMDAPPTTFYRCATCNGLVDPSKGRLWIGRWVCGDCFEERLERP